MDQGTKSLWLKGNPPFSTHALHEDVQCDVCIVGAGIAGLTCAYKLLMEGKSVVILEKETVASGESARTTAQFVNVLDDRFYNLIKYHGTEAAALAAESHTAAIAEVKKIIEKEKIDCDFKQIKGYLFVREDGMEVELEKELKAMQEVGLKGAKMAKKAPIESFNTYSCIEVPEQAKLHPLKYLFALAKIVTQMGGKIYTHTEAETIEGGETASVKTKDHKTVTCKAIVVATNSPMNDFFPDLITIHMRQFSYRTYVITARIAKGILNDALYWDTGDPYHYIRIDEENENYDLVTIGGEDHKTGQETDTEACFDKLEKWIRKRFPIEKILYKWSGQVQEPNDGLAYIGHNPFDHENVYIITGDSGNGMTHGTIGGMLITDIIMGRKNPWEDLYSPSRISPMAAGIGIKEAVNTLTQFTDWLTPGEDLDTLLPEEGIVIRKGLLKVAVYKDSHSKLHAFDATCPHLGCIVQWNNSEKSWDCPCHGSRFDKDGNLIIGPSATGLSPYKI